MGRLTSLRHRSRRHVAIHVSGSHAWCCICRCPTCCPPARHRITPAKLTPCRTVDEERRGARPASRPAPSSTPDLRTGATSSETRSRRASACVSAPVGSSRVPHPVPRRRGRTSGGEPQAGAGAHSCITLVRGLLSVHGSSRPACSCSPNPLRTPNTGSFGRFVTSTTVPIATGWRDRCRMGIAPIERMRLFTAHRGIRTGRHGARPRFVPAARMRRQLRRVG